MPTIFKIPSLFKKNYSTFWDRISLLFHSAFIIWHTYFPVLKSPMGLHISDAIKNQWISLEITQEFVHRGFISHCHGLWDNLDAHSVYHRHCQKAALIWNIVLYATKWLRLLKVCCRNMFYTLLRRLWAHNCSPGFLFAFFSKIISYNTTKGIFFQIR